MLTCSRVAVLARNSGSHRCRLKLTGYNSVAGMATEAGSRLIARKHPAHGLKKSGRMDLPIAYRDVEPVDGRIVADVTFVELPITLQHKGLCAYSEDIAERKRDRLGSVRNAVQNLITLALNL